jgi:peptidoglycan-N-acetylglucosamine deacetylase
MPDPSGPVFFDSSGKRSVLVSTIKATAYFLAAFLITFLLVNVIVAPTLPALKLSDSPSQFGPAFRPFEKAEAAEPPVEWRRHRSATPLAAGGGKRYAFFANWDDKSFSSLKQHYEDIDVLMPTWLHLDGSMGGIHSRRSGQRGNGPGLDLRHVGEF